MPALDINVVQLNLGRQRLLVFGLAWFPQSSGDPGSFALPLMGGVDGYGRSLAFKVFLFISLPLSFFWFAYSACR